MKIPEGWPTDAMLLAAVNSGADGTFDELTKSFKAMLEAAPTPPEEVQMKKDGNAASPNQNIVAIFTAILSALEQQPLGADFEKVLYNNLSELNESNTPAVEDEPIGYMDGTGRMYSRMDAEQAIDDVTLSHLTKLYTRPKSDNSAEKIAQMLEAIKEVDVLIRNNLPVDKTTPAWRMIKKILYNRDAGDRTAAQSDELRIVIEEAVEILERYHEAGIVSKLLALLDP